MASYFRSSSVLIHAFALSSYSPTKFALRGFAESLHMELLPYKISISVLFPPNTETEGFKVDVLEIGFTVHPFICFVGL